MAGPNQPGDAPFEGLSQIRTFLIADVRGYTLFTQERGDEGAGKLAAKFADIAREVVEARGGTLLELRGDEALCVFASTRDAIRAAVDMQARFVEETLDQPELPLTVGIGLDAGEAVPVQGGYRGGALNLAARLCGQARAGEILASREVAHLARRMDGVRYEDRGRLALKGLSEAVSIVRVVAEDVDTIERLRPFAPSPPAKRKPSRRWVIAGGVALALALVAISIPLLLSGEETTTIGTNSVARMNADGGVELAAALGQRPGASAVGFGSLWVAQPDRGFVVRLDLGDGSVSDTIEVGNSPAGVAVGQGSVWVTNGADGTVSRIDPETNVVSDTFNAGSVPSGIAVGGGALWVADTVGAALLRVDPASHEIQAVAVAGQPSGVAFTPSGVWVSVAPAGVARVDLNDPSVTLTQTVGSGPTAVLSAFGSIWVANHLDGSVTRLEPSTGRVQSTISVGEGPNALGAAGGTLWVANEFDDSISLIDPASNAVERTVQVGASAASLAVEGDSLWLAVGASAAEHRGGTMVIASDEPAVPTLDPAVVYEVVGWQILAVTHDGLLGYKKVGGPDGTTLVPNLASALPQVSADGLSYRFVMRRGIRFSNGDLVRPEDVRRGIERAIALSGDAAQLLRAIDGSGPCHESPQTCDLSDSIVVDGDSIEIRLSRPDTDLPFKLALSFGAAVPSDTPMEDQRLDPIPGTGPYTIAVANGDEFRLARNRHFRQWSGAAQPEGFVDAISWRFRQEQSDAFQQLNAGEVDWLAQPPRAQDLASLQAAHPDQVVQAPQAFTVHLGFDVLKPPFDDPRVRQALNYAIDRERVVELFGGPTQHRPTCQILPPNFQGYVPFCPYTREPEAGVWSAADVDRARALIRDAGAEGARVTALVMKSDPFLPNAVEVIQHVVDVMNEIGLDANLSVVPDSGVYFEERVYAPPGSPAHPQVYLSGWIQDYPGASNFIIPNFGCESLNPLGYCSEALDARIDEAQRLQASDPGAANRAWTAIEHQLVEDALWAPLTNPVFTYAVSGRTGNVQVHPQWGLLLSRLWVR